MHQTTRSLTKRFKLWTTHIRWFNFSISITASHFLKVRERISFCLPRCLLKFHWTNFDCFIEFHYEKRTSRTSLLAQNRSLLSSKSELHTFSSMSYRSYQWSFEARSSRWRFCCPLKWLCFSCWPTLCRGSSRIRVPTRIRPKSALRIFRSRIPERTKHKDLPHLVEFVQNYTYLVVCPRYVFRDTIASRNRTKIGYLFLGPGHSWPEDRSGDVFDNKIGVRVSRVEAVGDRRVVRLDAPMSY